MKSFQIVLSNNLCDYGTAIANDMRIENIIPQHLEAIVMKLQEVGINMEVGSDFIHVFKTDKPLNVQKS